MDSDATVTQNVKISSPVAVESSVIETSAGTPGGFLAEHWDKLLLGLLGFYDLVARLTPTTKDNSVVNFLTNLLNAVIPNLKMGGKIF